MANTLAVCAGPISYTDPATGNLTVIPVGALTFDSSGNLQVAAPYNKTPMPPTPNYLNSWLTYLTQNGSVQPAPAVSPVPAMILQAANAGSQGNNVQVSIAVSAANPDPTQTTFKIIITETDNYSGLTPASIPGILANEKQSGTQPGLVQLLSTNPAPTMPAKLLATALIGGADAAGSTAAIAANLPIPGSSGTAFTLYARSAGAAGNSTKVTITPDVSGTSFSLTATWTSSATTTILALAPTILSQFNYEINALPPTGSWLPTPGTYSLTGGIDGAAPAFATLVVPA